MNVKRIYFTVTNDLTYDQRMHRICHSLATHGYKVTLVGRKLPFSRPVVTKSFDQVRIHCLFKKSALFYIEYNIRLFLFLLFKKMDAVCAVDLDTILPCLYISKWKKIPRIYDAHEYFTELKEVWTRPRIKAVWTKIETHALPQFSYGYSVSDGLTEIYNVKYRKQFITIRNLPVLKPLTKHRSAEKFLLFQGAVNEARGLEILIPAMKQIPYRLVICGDGNFMEQLKQLIVLHNISEKIELKGMILPEEMFPIAQQATLGIALAEKEGLNQYLALPNKFLDYIQAGLPQLTMNFPEYQKINNRYKVAILIDEPTIQTIAEKINQVMANDDLLNELHQNCLVAREQLNWSSEESKLISYYNNIV